MMNQPDNLAARFLKSRYYPQGNFLSATLGNMPPFAWRSLIFGRELLNKGFKKEIGNGGDTTVWLDKWVDDPSEGMRAPWRKNYNFDVNLRVKSLVDPVSRRWNMDALGEIFVPDDIDIITRRQPVVGKEDFYSWKFNKSGTLTVKSAYWLACDVKTRLQQP